MSRDVSPDVSPDVRAESRDDLPWTFVERGSFVFGSCGLCGFSTPGRRARYSAEADMGAHAVTCHADGSVERTQTPEPV